ncbi:MULTISPECIES: group I intron-associated PD-(D/E)XK endonuclease [Peribacillus]|uniref:PD(D/E)XK endonuclease domain-containing protein n=1 Tax=Peribacillus butanolivorans TaxID=421767 RepID=A0ABM6XN79_9BACI|nr:MULTISPECIES: group I intron-associated PD-(D/E)XK endonuclease [Peribacillus]AXN39820.1 hypothetical protein DTO10_16590 [Peribacillus butanolivorans]MED3832976.1 group I intron-associated PD-(D/E)XK endonuclease [Peribacillus frigoritolerans]MED3845567.1 group I intron-associated PD-(D/E)XK endonuclease [Peribacillus frigoritolerans]
MAHDTATKGRHAELIAVTALLANGWTVMEPTVPDAFDLGITRPGWTELKRVQVKSARARNKDGTDWIVVPGAKNNGSVYSKDEADYFIGVFDGVAYMFENREICEYWVKPAELSAKWTKLDASIGNLNLEAV